MNQQPRFQRNHLQIIALVYLPFFLFGLTQLPDLRIFFYYLTGPFAGMAQFGWNEGYWDSSWAVARLVLPIMAVGFLLQIVIRPGPLANLWRYLTWG